MTDRHNGPRRTRADFKEILAQSGFCSCCGYDGLSVAFDVPVEVIQSLSEEQKRALMRQLSHLSDAVDKALEHRDEELDGRMPEGRLLNLGRLRGRCAA